MTPPPVPTPLPLLRPQGGGELGILGFSGGLRSQAVPHSYPYVVYAARHPLRPSGDGNWAPGAQFPWAVGTGPYASGDVAQGEGGLIHYTLDSLNNADRPPSICPRVY